MMRAAFEDGCWPYSPPRLRSAPFVHIAIRSLVTARLSRFTVCRWDGWAGRGECGSQWGVDKI